MKTHTPTQDGPAPFKPNHLRRILAELEAREDMLDQLRDVPTVLRPVVPVQDGPVDDEGDEV